MNTDPTNTSEITFLFKRPENISELGQPLNVALAMGAFASRMAQEERTRTIHPDGRRENVAEHSYMLAKVATALAEELYPWMNRGKVALYAISHDDPEAYVGDTPTDPIAKHDPTIKKRREHAAVQQLSYEYHDISPSYVNDIVAYEAQASDDYEAQFVRIVDKFMVILIHIPNDGKTLRENYTYDELVAHYYEGEKRLLEQYPHFIELIELRTELGICIADRYLR